MSEPTGDVVGVGPGKGPDAMVYGVSSPDAAAAASAPSVSSAMAPVCSEKDPWAGGVEDPWAGAAQAQPAQPSQPDQYDWSLDAMGKGKGKGPLQCYNCLGDGHPQFLCRLG